MKLVHAISWSVIGQYLTLIFQLGLSIYLARTYITPQHLGSFAIAMAVTGSLSALQDFGLSRYLLTESNLTEEKRRDVLTAALALAGIACGLSAASAPAIAAALHLPELRSLILILCIPALLAPALLFPLADLQRGLHFQSLVIIDLAGVVVNGAVTIWLARDGYNAMALAGGVLCQQVTRLGLALLFAPAKLPWPPARTIPAHLLHKGKGMSLINFCWLVAEKAPDLILGHTFGAYGAGLFARAKGLANQMRVLLSSSASSVLVAATAQDQREGRTSVPSYPKMARGYCAVSWPALLGLALLAEPITLFVFGANWVGVAPLLFWLALAQIPLCMLPMHSDLSILQGQIGPLLSRALLDTAATIAFLLLASAFSLEAAAASRVVAGMVWLTLYANQVQRLAGFDWRAIAVIYMECAVAAAAAGSVPLTARILWTTDQLSDPKLLFPLIGCSALVWALAWAVILAVPKRRATA